MGALIEAIKKIMGDQQQESLPRFFVIVASPRTGSNYLCDLLGSHPQVVCHNEIFHRHGPSVYLINLPKEDLLYDVSWRKKCPEQFIKRLIESTLQEAKKSVHGIGCKLLLNEFQPALGLGPLLALRPYIIFLTRENKLASFSSLHIANQTNIWATNVAPTGPQYQITFDEKCYKQYLQEQTTFEASALTKIKAAKLPLYETTYEKLFSHDIQQELLAFLRLAPASLTANTVKQNASNLLERFTNPEVVAAFLQKINQVEWAY